AGQLGTDGLPVEGSELAVGIRINVDRDSATPGNCIGRRTAQLGGWGEDLLLSGPDNLWDYPSQTAPQCNGTNGLGPGDYIVSLDYYRANAGGMTSSQPPPIDIKVTVLNPLSITVTSDNFVSGGSVRINLDIAGSGEAGTWSATAQSLGVYGPCSGPITFPDGATSWGTDRIVTFPSPDFLSHCGNIGKSGNYFIQVSYRYRYPNGGQSQDKFLDASFTIRPVQFVVHGPLGADPTLIGIHDLIASGAYGEAITSLKVRCPQGGESTATAAAIQAMNNALGPGNTGLARSWPSSNFEGPCDLSESGDFVVTLNTLHQSFSGQFDFINVDDTTDTDGDGLPDVRDNCDDIDNPGQEDFILDGQGDLCDDDDDNDGVPDSSDNCPRFISPSGEVSPSQNNFDGDSMGDICDPDDDADGLSDAEERAAGTDPFSLTPYSPGVNPYAGGAPTGTSNPATAGESVGVVISPPDSADSVGVVVTGPNGAVVYQETLIPQSPVAFSFVPGVPGAWTISADYFAGATKVDSVSHVLMVTAAAGTPTPTATPPATASPSATPSPTATATATPTNAGAVSVVPVVAAPTAQPSVVATPPGSATAAPTPAAPLAPPGAPPAPATAGSPAPVAIAPVTIPGPPATGIGNGQRQSQSAWRWVAGVVVVVSGGTILAGQRIRR
ncbi:MAG: thrombospondin type 3 repeat-containing protein, partial [Dehalococcoidia bacterium]